MNPTDRLEERVASAFFGRFSALRPAQESAIEPILAGLACALLLVADGYALHTTWRYYWL